MYTQAKTTAIEILFDIPHWRAQDSCRFLPSEESGAAVAIGPDFGGEELLERLGFG
jgi:hypothetical protein